MKFSAHCNELRFYNPTGSFDWATISLSSRPPLREVFCRNFKYTIQCHELQKYKNLNRPCAQGLQYQKLHGCHVRSQRPRGLRCGSAAPRLLELQVRIQQGAWMPVVSVVCFHVEFTASGWSLVQRSPTECGVPECDREASIMRRRWPTGGCWAMGKETRTSR
jgi:hypothetical protein